MTQIRSQPGSTRVSTPTPAPIGALTAPADAPLFATPLAPASARDKSARVEAPAVPATRASAARVKVLEALAKDIADTVRAHPLETSYVARAFAKADDKAINLILDGWQAEASSRDCYGGLLYLPRNAALADDERARNLGGVVVKALAELSRNGRNGALSEWVSRVGDLIGNATATNHRAVLAQRVETLSELAQALVQLPRSHDERKILTQLLSQARTLVALANPHQSAMRKEIEALGGACAEVVRYLRFPQPASDTQVDNRLRLLLPARDVQALSRSERTLFAAALAPCTDANEICSRVSLLRECETMLRGFPATDREEILRTLCTGDADERDFLSEYITQPFFFELSVQDRNALLRALKQPPSVRSIPAVLEWHRHQFVAKVCAAHLSPAGKEELAHFADTVPLPLHAVQTLTLGATTRCTESSDARGVAVHFVDGPRTHVSYSADSEQKGVQYAQLVRVLARMPAIMRQHMPKEIVLSDADRRTRTRIVLADTNAARIRFYQGSAKADDDELGDTLLHELGHSLAFASFGDNPPSPGWARWESAGTQDALAPSGYSADSLHEDFAESLVLYAQCLGTDSEAALRLLYPARFAVLDKLFHAQC